MKIDSPAFFIDIGICTGCKTCMVACKDKNSLGDGIRWRRVYEFTGGQWTPRDDGLYTPDLFTYYLSIACNHCENPACVAACPTRAMAKNADGIVYVDASRCVGCRYCEWACPYSAPQFDPDRGVMAKCDFCRTKEHEAASPACAAACPTRALTFGDYDRLKKEQGSSAGIPPLPDPALTSPCLVIRPPRKKGEDREARGMILNPEEVRDA